MNSNHKNIQFGVILGSGLNSLKDYFPLLENVYETSSGVHKKHVFIAEVNGHPVLFLSGRNHIYEGSTKEKLFENISLAKKFNLKNLLITNAAGGLNDNFLISDLMLIRDHINLSIKHQRTRSIFLYDSILKNLFEKICLKEKLIFREGIYGCLLGPVYETSSETRFFKKYKIDALGMSTIPEVNEAHSSHIRVIAVSVITNMLKENIVQKITHSEVEKAGSSAVLPLIKLIKGLTLELN